MMNGKLHLNECFKRTGATVAIAVALLASSGVRADEETLEKEMRQGLGALLNGRAELSLKHTLSLLEQHSNFRLGRLIYADLLAANAHQNTLMATPGALKKTRIKGLIEEAQARVHYLKPPVGHLPGPVMRLSSLHPYALVLDAASSRLHIFANKNGVPEPVADYYASTGNGGIGKTSEGDEKTPLGVYHLKSYLDDDELPELYGVGAYPINYPNQWDRLHKRDGFGIWLHGTPRPVYSRPPEDSRGCIVMSNGLVTALSSYIDLGRTPIVIAHKLEWLRPNEWQARREQLLGTIRQWQQDWKARDIERYLSHYSRDYRTAEQDYKQMESAARLNSKKKTFVEVGIENIDLFNYPGETGTFVAVFDQDYRSNNYNSRYRKQQFWQYKDNRWKIVFESPAETSS